MHFQVISEVVFFCSKLHTTTKIPEHSLKSYLKHKQPSKISSCSRIEIEFDVFTIESQTYYPSFQFLSTFPIISGPHDCNHSWNLLPTIIQR